jgi:hypothetical protein
MMQHRFRVAESSHRSLCTGPVALHRTQQSPAHHEQVRKARRDLHSMQVLGQSPISHLLEPEHALDHLDGVLDLGADLGLGAIDPLDPLIDPVSPRAPLVVLEGNTNRTASRYGARSLLSMFAAEIQDPRLE